MHHPITIIGAGPGGCFTAASLSRLGHEVLLLDRATFPRSKACGDILTSNVLRELHAFDPAWLEELVAQPWTHELRSTAFGGPAGQAVAVPFESPSNLKLGIPSCLSARRHDFDAWLLGKVSQLPGVSLRTGVQVSDLGPTGSGQRGQYRLTIDGETLTTDLLVLATGANSPLVQRLFPSEKLVPRHSAVGLRAYFTGAELPAAEGGSEYFLFQRRLMPGGLYVTPFADGSVNVNLVMRYDIWKRRQVQLRQLLPEYLAAHPELGPRFAEARQEGPAAGCLLYLGTRRRRLSTQACLVVGDAGGLTDATNANGIGHAMISGGLAAQAAHAALASGDLSAAALRAYDRAVYDRLANALRPGKVMKYLFANQVVGAMTAGLLESSLKRLNGKAIEELVYSKNTAGTLLNPAFYWRLFAKT